MTAGPQARHRDLRWDGRAVRVSTPVPGGVWQEVAAADPATLPFHTPQWRDCVSAASGWHDASRLYELPGDRRLVLMMARRRAAPGVTVAASWPPGWGSGGVLAPGGLRPEEAALICADLARDRAVSVSIRPGFAAAAAWASGGGGARRVPRAVHVACFAGRSFGEFLADRVPARTRRGLAAARRHQQAAGVTVTCGNSPELVAALYQVYLRWAAWRAGQRKVPGMVAGWQARRAEPPGKFPAVAGLLGGGCRIWVARWQGQPAAAAVSLYAGQAAVGWRAFTDRAVPGRFRLFETLAMAGLQDACEAGCRYLEMGESVGRADLARVKERLGGTEHAFAEYCFERVPLTPARMAWQRLRRRAEKRLTGRRP